MKVELTSLERTPIGVGVYLAIIEIVELKETKAKDGKIISVMFRIVGPKCVGYVLYRNFLIESSTHSGAAYHGTKAYLELLEVLGKTPETDTDELVGMSVKINVGITNSDRYGTQNEITGFSRASDVPYAEEQEIEEIEF